MYVLTVLFHVIILWTSSISPMKNKIKKCWFGEPLEKYCNNDQDCPSEYICVKRSDPFAKPKTWVGCCPKGKGSCDTKKQRTDPTILDIGIPECDDNGMFKSEQCQFPGCLCTLPNGTTLANTFAEHGPARAQRNCDDLVKAVLEQERKPGIFKCWFGKPGKSPCKDDSDCKKDQICVHRINPEAKPSRWDGCCKRGKGPCLTATQRVDPAAQDASEPSCTKNGLYKPEQCLFFGCFCSYPNGTFLEDTLNEGGPRKIPCDDIIKGGDGGACTTDPNWKMGGKIKTKVNGKRVVCKKCSCAELKDKHIKILKKACRKKAVVRDKCCALCKQHGFLP